MTVQEVKKRLEALQYRILHNVFCNKVHNAELEALNIAIECMEEVEQYRALGTVEELKEAKKLLEKLEELKFANEQPKTDWIPCEERLPIIEREPSVYATDVGERFLVTCEEGYVCESTFWKKVNKFEDDVIAWMPKPQPYKKEGAE